MKKILRDIIAFLVIVLVLYLFYKSVFVIIPAIPCFIIYKKLSASGELKKKKETLLYQFKDFLQSMSASLRAGYSVENAIGECYGEMKTMHGEGAVICRECQRMLNQLKIAIPPEKIFEDLAKRSGVEDIEMFAAVFSVAKNSGGDMVEIIQKTADDITARVETKKEIELMVASKRFEQNIMNVVPLGIIVYVSISSNGLLDPLYGNATGIAIMTICLIVYAAALLLSRKIMDIDI